MTGAGDGRDGVDGPVEGEPPDLNPSDHPPLTELAGFSLDSDPEFADRVARAIEVRETASSVVELGSHGLLAVLMEYLGALFSLFGRDDSSEERG